MISEAFNFILLLLLIVLKQQIVHETSDSVRRDKERRALELLQKPQAKYDIDHALILCQMNNFKVGILFLYEKAHLYQVKESASLIVLCGVKTYYL